MTTLRTLCEAAADICDRISLEPADIVGVNIYEHGTTMHLRAEPMLRVMKKLNVKDLRLGTSGMDDLDEIHVTFYAAGFEWTAIMDASEESRIPREAFA